MSFVWGEENAKMHYVDLCLLFGGRECADAFRLISVVSFYVCCLGKRMRIRIPFDFCSVFLCLLFGGRECADAFRLISVVSFYVCGLGGRECADAFRLISVVSFNVCCLGEGNAHMHSV